MKRFALVLFLLTIAFCGIGSVGSRAQRTVFVPLCSGTNDTAAFQAIISGAASNPRTIKIPYQSDLTYACKVTTMTSPETLLLIIPAGSGIAREAPNVVTVLGPVVNPDGKTLFFGSGTTSFADNTFVVTKQSRPSNVVGVDTGDNRPRMTASRVTIKPVPIFDLASDTLAVGQICSSRARAIAPALVPTSSRRSLGPTRLDSQSKTSRQPITTAITRNTASRNTPRPMMSVGNQK